MKRLVALKTIYHGGVLIRAGTEYSADEYVARDHIREKLAREIAIPRGGEKTKVAGPSKQKENANVADTRVAKTSGRKTKRRA